MSRYRNDASVTEQEQPRQFGDYCECCDPDVTWCANRTSPKTGSEVFALRACPSCGHAVLHTAEDGCVDCRCPLLVDYLGPAAFRWRAGVAAPPQGQSETGSA